MASKTSDLVFNLIGHDKTGPATKSAASNLDHVSKSATNMGKVFAGVAAGAGLAVLGKQAMDFAKDSVAAFTTVGKEAGSLQRVMGGTIEEASSMRGMFKLAGVDAEQAGKSMGLFSKSIVNNADAFAGMGVAVRDAGGQIRPTNDILKDTAERFKAMPNGAEKTALAMELFGKSGAAMLPFLNRGAEGLAALEQKTAEYGLTLTKVDQEAIGGAIKAQRELDMAMEGAKVTLGAGLAPLFTEAKTAMAEMAVPLTQALLPGFEAIGDVAMLALTQIRDNMPAVEAGVERFAGFLRDASTVVQDNWPQIVETVEGLAGALQRVSGFAGAMWDAFSAMPPEAQQTLATLAVLDATGVIDVKLMVTPMLSAGVGGVLASIFTGAAAAVSIPVTIGIAAYVGAVTWVWNQEWYEEPRRLVETTMNMVFSDGITAGLADVPGVMWAGLWQAFIVPWQTMWQFMGEVASNAWAAITSTITTALTNAGTSIGVFGANIIGGLAATWSQIQGEASAAWNRVLTGVQSYLQFIEMGMEQFSASITGTVSGAWANVQQVTTGALAAIGNAVSGAVGFIGSLWSGAWSAIAGATSSVMDLITGRIGQGLGAIQGLFEGAVSAIGAIWGRVADVVRAPIAAMFGWINSNMIGPINDVLGKFSDAVKLGTLPTFHTGGFTGDQLSNREGLALLRNDEYVMGPEATARNRPLLEALNAGRQGFGIGGPFDIIGDIVGDIAGLVARGASAVMSTVSAPLIGALRGQFGGDWSPNVVIGGMDHVLKEVGTWATARDAKAAAASALATASGGFIGPASGLLGSPLNPYVVTSEFGMRGGVMHAGIDLGAPTGQPIMAAGAGKVMQAGWNDGYGNYAALDHGGGLWSTYGHMSALASTAGQVLSAGQVLGYVGSTGDSTGPHLHFETRQNGSPINPRSFFAFDQGGYLPPGASAVWNGTGKPEPVFTADQWGKIKDRPIVVQVLLDGRQMHEAQVRYLRDAGVSA